MITLVKRVLNYFQTKKSLRTIYNITGFIDSAVIILDEHFKIKYANNEAKKFLRNNCKGYIKTVFNELNYNLEINDSIDTIRTTLNSQYVWKGNLINSVNDNDKNIYYDCVIYNLMSKNQFVLVVNKHSFKYLDLKVKNKENFCYERRYSKLFDFCTDLIYIVSVDNLEILDINLAACQYLGLEKNEVLGRNMQQIFFKEFNIKKQTIDMIKNHKLPQRNEFSINNNGNIVYFEVNYSPIYNENDEVLGVLCLARDITERNRIVKLELEKEKNERMLQEIKQYDKIKTDFFANISHELRTPINVIFSAIQVMDIRIDNIKYSKGQYHKYSKIIKQNCYRLLKVINNLIDITKIDSEYLSMNMGNYEIVRIVEDITLSVVEYASRKKINITFDTSTEEKFIACDPDKIERIMLNLLSNAIKFTDLGGKICINIKDNSDGYVYIHIRDTGRGIPKEKIEAIFERFLQVDKSLTRDHEGAGIGLYLVKLLVELQEGNVYVKSEINRGTEFIVKLPDRTIPFLNNTLSKRNLEEKMERINMEFSDIYDININYF